MATQQAVIQAAHSQHQKQQKATARKQTNNRIISAFWKIKNGQILFFQQSAISKQQQQEAAAAKATQTVGQTAPKSSTNKNKHLGPKLQGCVGFFNGQRPQSVPKAAAKAAAKTVATTRKNQQKQHHKQQCAEIGSKRNEQQKNSTQKGKPISNSNKK